jgi:hypothetical protein
MAIELLSALRPAVVAALPVSPAKGDTVVLSGDGHLWTYNGAAWVDNGASSGGSTPLPQAVSTQAAWYIDPATGNDANNGLTSGTAIATWAELGARLNGKRIPQQTIVHVMSDTPDTDPIYLDICIDGGGGYFAITGANGIVATARAGSAATALSAPANTRASVTAPVGFPLAPGQLIRGSNGAFHWVHKATGLVAGLDAGCDVDLVPPAFVYPDVTLPPTDSYDEWRLPRVYPGLLRVTQYRSGQAYLLIDALDIGTDGALDVFEPTAPSLGFAVMTRCRVRSFSSGMIGGSSANIIKCYFDSLNPQATALNGFYTWCTIRRCEVFAGNGVTFADCTFAATAGGTRYNESLKLMTGSSAVIQNCGFFDGVLNGIVLTPFSNLESAGATYGTSAGSGVLIGGGAQFAFTQRPTIAGAAANFKFTDNADTSAKAWASVPLTAPYTLVSNPGSSGGISGFVTVDFGVSGGQLAETVVVDPSVSASTVFVANLQGSTADNGAFVHSILPATARFEVNPGVGYTVRVRSDWKVFGSVEVGYLRG